MLQFIKKRSVYPLHVPFADRSLPQRIQRIPDFLSARQLEEIVRKLNLLSGFRKQQSELRVGRPKDAEGTVFRSINDLNVLHSVSFSDGEDVIRNRCRIGAVGVCQTGDAAGRARAVMPTD
jgi:hypothetical protein